jgi:cell division protein FtsB
MLAVAFVLGSGVLVAIGLRFPGEVNRWMETRDEIHQLRQQNADLIKLREKREERLRKYLENNDSLELEIRQQLDLHHPDETIYVLPPKSPAKRSETPR